MNSQAAGMLGILNRAKKVAFGPAIEGAMRKGHLLLLALDASPRTQKELRAKATNANVPVDMTLTQAELGAPLGRDGLSAVLILDQKGAASLLHKLQKGE